MICARCCSAFLLAASVASPAAAAQTLPPLPRLVLDAYPGPVRDDLSRAHRNALEQSMDADAVGALGRTLHAWEQWSAAHEAYRRAQVLASHTFEWHYLDAVVRQRAAHHGEAAERLREALALSPGYVPARARLADALLETGALDESEALFRALIQEPAAEPIAELGLGRIAAAHRRHETAVGHLQRAVTLFPELGAAHYALALSYRALGRRDEARAALALHEKYGARWPAVDDPVLSRVTMLRDDPRAQVQRGMKLADAGDIEGAIALHEGALARDPALAQAHGNLISLYGRTKDWVKAEAHYRRAVALGVNLGDAHYDYGVLLGMQDKWDAAADAYRQALAVNPQHAHTHNNLGQILERQQRFADAAAEYREALASYPAFRLARFNLGRMLVALDRPAEAASELEKILEPRDAEAPRYLFALGVAYVRAGRKDKGITWAIEARRLALEFGQHELASAIARDLASLK